MLNMGFKDDLDEILSYTPKDKITWLFSATMPHEIRRIVNTYMTEPFEVKIDAKQQVNRNIEHQVVHVRHHQKSQALKRFVDLDPDIRALVFCRTKLDTQGLAEDLMADGYAADAIHGDLSQAQRDRVMKRFKSHELPILVATDVASRGIDVNDLTHVFHFALPDDPAYYTHRAGRTARAGKLGISMVLLGAQDNYKLRRFERELDIKFEQVQIPEAKDIANIRLKNWAGQILEQKTKNKIPEGLFEELETLWANLTKEELMAKFIATEANKLNLNENESLNVNHSRSGGGGGDRRGGGGGRDRRSGGGGRDRRSGGGGRDRRSGGSSDRRSSGGSSDRRSSGGSSDRRSSGGSSDRRGSDGGPSFKAKRKPFGEGGDRPFTKRKPRDGGDDGNRASHY
jgi:ATP-dependent RNA helicase DeaD